jgi:hypothetical protein
MIIPAVLLAPAVLFEALYALLVEAYPEVTKPEVAPIRTSMLLVPDLLTPLKITVIRFTQDGMPVKSMLVPLVVF